METRAESERKKKKRRRQSANQIQSNRSGAGMAGLYITTLPTRGTLPNPPREKKKRKRKQQKNK
jgi:hypothetical protein